jgi:flavin reductase (DIM6/NTAB) family NADH-FMN oxidoreductase RutF
MTLDPRAYRNTIGLFATGVTVVTTEVNGEVHGMTANAVASLSLDPMLLLVSVGKKAHMAGLLQTTPTFTVNILRADQESLSTYFAGGWKQPEPPPFQLVRWEGQPQMGSTRLEDALAAIACVKYEILEGGDHWIVIGRVVALHQGAPPHSPILFYGGRYYQLDVTKEHPAPPRRDL